MRDTPGVQASAVELFRTYVAPRRRQALLLAVLLAGSIGLQLVNPQLLRFVIDSALAGADPTSLTLAALAFIAIALVTQLLTAGAQYVGASLGWTATNDLRADLTLHCLRLDLGFHKGRTPGELVERVDGDVTALAGFFSRFAVTLLGNAALLVGVLFMLWREDWRAGAALSGFAVVAVGVLLSLRTVAVDRWRRQREVSAQMFGFFGERLAGTEDIRSSGAVPYVMAELGLHHAAWLAARRSAGVGTSTIYSATVVTFAAGAAIAFAVGGYLWLTGTITLGTVYLVFYYTELLRRPIEEMRRELEDMQQAFASIARVDELLRMTSRLRDGTTSLPLGPLEVALEHVSFGYDEEPVLRDVTIRIPPGRVLGLLGRTGSGKTTLARLLLRFYDPASGTVRLGGTDLREAALEDVRGRATLVSQDVQLFHASVRDNVTLFDRSVDDARVLLALNRIGLGEWSDRAGGLDAEMTADSLSAGEAQLLALARAFVRDPGLVILDEASSRLDPATERRLEEAIDTLFAGRTALVIAHRLETLDRCDEIAILETGRVIERGARSDLAADGSTRFAQLLRAGPQAALA
jgi:ATP-binding cassette subfamily B protein